MDTAGEFFLIGTPVGRLCRDDASRIRRVNCRSSFLVRQIKYRTRLEPVDIATDERIRIAALDRDQHLFKAYTIALGFPRDLAERVSALDFIAAGGFAGRGCGWLGGRCRLLCRRRSDRGRSNRRARRCRSRSRRCDRGRRGYGSTRRFSLRYRLRIAGRDLRNRRPHFNRVKQECVLPNQAASRPVQLHEHVNKRIVDRLGGLQAYEKLAGRTASDCKAHTQKC